MTAARLIEACMVPGGIEMRKASRRSLRGVQYWNYCLVEFVTQSRYRCRLSLERKGRVRRGSDVS